MNPCRSCGACCVVSDIPSWTEQPEVLSTTDGREVCVTAGRCSAFKGAVGLHATCQVYAVRPGLCRTFPVGGEECLMARRLFGLPLDVVDCGLEASC